MAEKDAEKHAAPSPLQCHIYPFMSAPSLSKTCTFASSQFLFVMHNLIVNPKITSSHLFRADIFWDSEKDAGFNPSANHDESEELSSFVKHMKPAYRPLKIDLAGFELKRTMLRQLVPRNPQLDRPLVQTCHFFATRARRKSSRSDCDQYVGHPSSDDNDRKLGGEQTLVVYLPHATSPDEIPFYHPPLRALGFLHTSARSGSIDSQSSAILSIHFSPFDLNHSTSSSTEWASSQLPDSTTPTLSTRTYRTLTNLLNTIHKHATTEQTTGYTKCVHHDRIIPQKRSQDTYARLKSKYAKVLINEHWKEQTEVTKSIFEDLGIAAFLIELWRDMYHPPSQIQDKALDDERTNSAASSCADNKPAEGIRPPHPGFIDLACGNGVLVFILRSEGYSGWGFDARLRKTWDAFPIFVRESLQEAILVPSVLDPSQRSAGTPRSECSEPLTNELRATLTPTTTPPNAPPRPTPRILDGKFQQGTFLISNHADELTPWTPLLAFQNDSPFIAIPCCSHDCGGGKTRYASHFAARSDGGGDGGVTSQSKAATSAIVELEPGAATPASRNISSDTKQSPPADNEKKIGDLKKPHPSAYATLTGFIEYLTSTLGGRPEREVLRIPSTRNVCIVARCGWIAQRCEGGGGSGGDEAEKDSVGNVQDERGVDEGDGVGAAEKDGGSQAMMTDDECMRRKQAVRELIQREMKAPIEQVAESFRKRAMGVHESKGRNH